MAAARRDWTVVAETADRVGESPLWVADESAIYWVDVLGQAIHRLQLATARVDRWAVPEPIGFIAPRAPRDGFIVGLRSGIYRLRLADPLSLTLLVRPEVDLPGNRINDGKVDAEGRLWFGTMPMSGDVPEGSLYRLDRDGRCVRMDGCYSVANGPAFSPDGAYLYHADTPERVIYRFEVDEAGALCGKIPFVRFPVDWGFPDGMTVDAEGFLWVAHWDGGGVSRFDPAGERERMIALPVSRATSCVFGGSARDRLFVTSAREGRPDEPLAGALFEIQPGAAGLPGTAFAE